MVKHVGRHPSATQAALIGRGLAFSIFPGASVISRTIRVVIASPSASMPVRPHRGRSPAHTVGVILGVHHRGNTRARASRGWPFGPEEFSSPSRDVIVQLECRASKAGATRSLGRPQHQHVATGRSLGNHQRQRIRQLQHLWRARDAADAYLLLQRASCSADPTPPDFTQQIYLIADLAVGGTWPGVTGEDATMKIDYIRAFPSDFSIPAVAHRHLLA